MTHYMHPGADPIVLTPPTAPNRPISMEIDDARSDASDEEVHGFDDRKPSFRVTMLELYKS